MTTLLYTHPACLEHLTGTGHPESPDRLRAVLKALDTPDFAALIRREAPMGTIEQVERVHDADYIDWVERSLPASGLAHLDADTVLSPGSWEAVMRGIGAACAAIDAVVAQEADNAFCAIRPCGHHAEPARAMGFCIFNQAAAAAAHAIAMHGFKRVCIVDFDVHHGNGTQAICWNHPDMLYASTHQSPLYPGTGAVSERGVSDNIVNAPLPYGAGSSDFREAFELGILPALDAFAPEFMVISAGFDAHRLDPLAGLRLDEDDYAWVTQRLMEVADTTCNGRIVSILEGGYDLGALAASCAAHVRALMNQ